MNRCIPDWNFEGDLPVSNQKKNMGPNHEELAELIWRNGQVVLHSQNHRKPNSEKHVPSPRSGVGSIGNSCNLIQDDETMSWIHYPVDDSFEKELCSNFFSELTSSDHVEHEKLVKFDVADHVIASSQSLPPPLPPPPPPPPRPQQQHNNLKHPAAPDLLGNPMPPPTTQIHEQNHGLGGFGKAVNVHFSQFSKPLKGDLTCLSGQFGGKVSGNLSQAEVRECSVMTVGSSNQIPIDLDVSRASNNGVGTVTLSAGPLKDDVRKVVSQSDKGKTETLDPTVTSSSGGSGSSFGRTCKQSTGISTHKRKSMDAEESECQSEAAELEPAAAKKLVKRSGSCRRSRAAEVHNLSERRRRDRINEKMRALQELIPNCNKTDKASMLDEAIEYLKSLQLQLQVMWMGSGMSPMMFPGIQHYMSSIGVGIGPPHLPSIPNPVHLSRFPLVDQSTSMALPQNQAVICQAPVLNPVNFQNQMQNPTFPGQYACFMGFHMQNPSQPMNMFRFGSQTVPQPQMLAPPSSSGGPLSSGATINDAPVCGKMG